MSEHAINKALLIQAIGMTAEGVAISDPNLPDNPLIFVNEGFETITGYTSEEVIGKNCRFLQGDASDPKASQTIRDAIKEGKSCVVELLNYKKDGSLFWNRLSLSPIRDENGNITNFVGIQSDITKSKNLEFTLAALAEAFLVYFGNQDSSFDRTLEDLNKIIASAHVEGHNLEKIKKLKKFIEEMESTKI